MEQYHRLHSESVKELATALAKAQAQIKHAEKDATNPHFRSEYSTLASVWDACREALTKNGLSVIQLAGYEGDKLVLKTTLLHSSGEQITGVMPIIMTKNDMQGYGSALTYARRYSLAGIAGVASADDDGNGASQPQVTQAKGLGQASVPPVSAVHMTNPAPHLPNVASVKASPVRSLGTLGGGSGAGVGGITEAQEKRLFAIGNGAGWAKNEIIHYIMSAFQVTPRNLNRQQYDKLCDQIIPKMSFAEAHQAMALEKASPEEQQALTESDVFI